MAMKMMKKALTVVAAAALAVAAIPALPAEAANVLVKYDFESGTGMSSTGFGTDPTVVSDPEMGNVLQFADGQASQYMTSQQDSSLGETEGHEGKEDSRIDPYTPSSLKFPNPFCGKSLSGMSISMWVKVPAGAVEEAPGLVGFVSDNVTEAHPDKRDPNQNVGGSKDHLSDSTGPYAWGICASAKNMDDIELFGGTGMLYQAGLFSNWFMYADENASFKTNADKWVHMVVSISDAINDTKVYINGQDCAGIAKAGKRYNKGEENGGQPGNTMEKTVTEILTMAEMPNAYVGYTGFSPTKAGVCIDDLTFYDAAVSASEAMDLYTAAQAELSGKAGSGTAGNTSGASGSDNNGDGGSNAGGDNASGGGSNASGSNATGNNSTSGNKTSTAKTGSSSTSSKNAQNLPQTGVVSTGVLVACGAAAVAGGAILFKKKEEEDK